MSRLFLDSNVFVGGFVAPWSFERVVLKYCAAHLHKLIYAEAVKAEVERFLLAYAQQHNADWLLEEYDKFIRLARPEVIPYPSREDVVAARPLIRHEADVPVILSAMRAAPDWLITSNTEHFTPEVGVRTGLRIVEPAAFVRATHT